MVIASHHPTARSFPRRCRPFRLPALPAPHPRHPYSYEPTSVTSQERRTRRLLPSQLPAAAHTLLSSSSIPYSCIPGGALWSSRLPWRITPARPPSVTKLTLFHELQHMHAGKITLSHSYKGESWQKHLRKGHKDVKKASRASCKLSEGHTLATCKSMPPHA